MTSDRGVNVPTRTQMMVRVTWTIVLAALGMYWLLMATSPFRAAATGDPVDVPGTSDPRIHLGFLVGLAVSAMAVGAIILSRRLDAAGLRWDPTARGYPGGTGGAALTLVGIVSLTILLPHIVFQPGALSSASGSGTIGTAQVINGITSSVAAGIFEEITLLALPVALLGGIVQRWSVTHGLLIWGVASVLRVGVHAYWQDWRLILIPLWMAAAVWLFHRTRTIWPLVIGHIAYDLVASGSDFLPSAGVYVAIGGLIATGVVAVYLAVRSVRSERPDQNERRPAHVKGSGRSRPALH